DTGTDEAVGSTTSRTKQPRRAVRAARNFDGLGIRSARDALARLGYHRPQLLAALEDRHRTRRDFDRVARARIARHPTLALTDLERAKSANFNVMLLCECGLDCVEK